MQLRRKLLGGGNWEEEAERKKLGGGSWDEEAEGGRWEEGGWEEATRGRKLVEFQRKPASLPSCCAAGRRPGGVGAAGFAAPATGGKRPNTKHPVHASWRTT